MQTPNGRAITLCPSVALVEGAAAVPFEVIYNGEACRAFAIRYQGVAYAYLNRCTHVAMEMDYQPNRFFDDSGQWLLCATHGAAYLPATGQCAAGPCRGGLVRITLSESGDRVHWHTAHGLEPAPFSRVE